MSKLSPFTLRGRAMAELGRAQGLRQAIRALRLQASPEAFRLAQLSDSAQRNAEKWNAKFEAAMNAEIEKAQS